MKEYFKISNLYKFDARYKNIVGYNQEFDYLKDNIWVGTEKIDGTNIRICWDGHEISYLGHTDKSIIPDNLKTYLDDLLMTAEMEYVFEQVFHEKEACIYCEGYGYKIQTNGNLYVENNECSIIVFDVLVNGLYLERNNVIEVSNKLGLQYVPIVFEGNLSEAEIFVSKHNNSSLNNGLHEMEGLVLETKMPLYYRNGNPIKCKLKYRDMLKGNRIK